MKRLVIAGALLCALGCGGGGGGGATSAMAQSFTDQQLFTVSKIAATVTCTNPGSKASGTWTNTTGGPIYIRSGQLSLGENEHAISDNAFGIGNLTTGDNYVGAIWDHYADSDRYIPVQWVVPNGTYYLVNPNDVVEFHVSCQGPYNGGSGTVAGVAGFSYTKLP